MLANTDTAITKGTGDILVFLAMSKAIGATINTVATLSTNAETIPANAANKMMAHLVDDTLLIIQSANKAGIPDSINSETTTMVPAMIINTFQFIAEEKTLLSSVKPISKNTPAMAMAIYALKLEKISNAI